MESLHLSHDLSNLGITLTYSQPFRFMPQDKQINDELHRALILVHSGPCRHCSHKIGHAEDLRQIEETCRLLRFQDRNIPIIDTSKLISAYRAVIRPLHEIENEGNRQDRDHDHEPVPVPAE